MLAASEVELMGEDSYHARADGCLREAQGHIHCKVPGQVSSRRDALLVNGMAASIYS